MAMLQHLRHLPHPERKIALMTSAPAAHAASIAAMNPAQTAQLAANVEAVGDKMLSPPPGGDTAAQAADLASIAKDHPAAFAIAQGLHSEALHAKWGAEDYVNPIGGPRRRKPYPVKILPATAVAPASGNLTLTWAPQEECEPFRIVFPSNAADITAGSLTYLNQLMVGDRLMQVSSGRIPFDSLRENSDVGRIDMPIVRLGELVTAQITGAPNGSTVAAVLFVYARGKPRYLPEGAQLLGIRYLPFDVTTLGASGTGTITLLPQRHCIIRRMSFDDGTTNFGNIYVQNINVQDQPQYIQNANIPIQLFSEQAVDDWWDFDMCQVGGSITIGVTNTNTSQNAIAQGVAIVDLVRLPTDPVQ